MAGGNKAGRTTRQSPTIHCMIFIEDSGDIRWIVFQVCRWRYPQTRLLLGRAIGGSFVLAKMSILDTVDS
jgi:hypothetical protein